MSLRDGLAAFAAKQKGSTYRVYWLSRKSAADFPMDRASVQAYGEAEKEFRLSEVTE
jgi:hypothetical protein